jgi:hypothetical protein
MVIFRRMIPLLFTSYTDTQISYASWLLTIKNNTLLDQQHTLQVKVKNGKLLKIAKT